MVQDILLVIDMQRGVLENDGQKIYHKEQLLETVNERIKKYREANLPIIFIQHHDSDLLRASDPWQFDPALAITKNDQVIEKNHPNSFYHTSLQKNLDQLHVQSIEFCGAQTEFCLDATIKFAHGLGYQGFIKADGYSTYDDQFLTAPQLNAFYRMIWQNRFLTVF